MAAGTPLGRDAKRYMDAGDLVPDTVMVGMIRERLDEDGADDFLLDGFPRTAAQAEALDLMLAELGTALDGVVLLAVPREALMERLTGRWMCRTCGRSFHETFAPYGGEPCESGADRCELYQRDDDKPAAIENRLDTYDAQTAPLIAYYSGAGLLREIDGARDPDAVYAQIAAAVAPGE